VSQTSPSRGALTCVLTALASTAFGLGFVAGWVGHDELSSPAPPPALERAVDVQSGPVPLPDDPVPETDK